MKKNWKKILLIAGIVVLLILAGLLMWIQPESINGVLITLGVLAVGWLAVEIYVRWNKKRKQKAFDEGISAREGIEDRRREWGGWVTELDRQGLDRYELPFYLLVGEPQAGKSILLQNSDLHFPFGQERLSGVGGTRGCDWWFTDEAVILDLAGRLFTHEHGVADKLEWESFLEMLAEFRPLCPANGVLLVVPCDSLLSDTPDQCAEKANRVQSGLLTLTQKLEAQLPVYLVLTKADKIFGFAESVHRLEARMRHEMFGWSRGYERADQPFDLREAKEGMDELVGRARILRERMLATARIPEALPEVDRLYAFPDELAGIWPSLEVYLKRVFTESGLVQRTTFRGIYLTSGLQTGAPIARACADLLGEAGEADRRDLESLFSNQRAYFIKDVIRRRVFEERGLVRPTEGRVARARQRSLIGYGLSGVLAVATIGFAIFQLVRDRDVAMESVFENTFLAVEEAIAEEQSISELLGVLSKVVASIDFERGQTERAFQTTKDEFEALYVDLFDHRLAPAIVKTVLADTRADVERFHDLLKGSSGESAFEEFEEIARMLEFFTLEGAELDFDEQKLVDVLTRRLPSGQLKDPERRFELEAAIARRNDLGPALYRLSEGELEAVRGLAVRMRPLFNETLKGGSPLQARGQVGFLVAWRTLEESFDGLDRRGLELDPARTLELARDYFRAKDRLDALLSDLPQGDSGNPELRAKNVQSVLEDLATWRGVLIEFAEPSGPDAEPPGWRELKDFSGFATRKLNQGEISESGGLLDIAISSVSPLRGRMGQAVQGNFTDNLKDDRLVLEIEPGYRDIERIVDDVLYAVCKAAPQPDWELGGAAEGLRLAQGILEQNDADPDRPPYQVFRSKCRAVGRGLAQFGDWREAARGFESSGPPDGLRHEFVRAIAEIAAELDGIEDLPDDVSRAPQRLLVGHLGSVRAAWNDVRPPGSQIDKPFLRTLERVIGCPALRPNSEAVLSARWLFFSHVIDRERHLLDGWRAAPLDPKATEQVLIALETHLGEINELIGPGGNGDGQNGRGVVVAEIDQHVEERLQELRARLEDHWSVRFTSVELVDVANRVLSELESASIFDRIQRASQTFPPIPDPAFGTGRLSLQEPFVRAEAAAAAVRELAPPSGSGQVQGQSLARDLEHLADTCIRRGGDIEAIAEVLRSTLAKHPLDRQGAYAGAGDFFVQQLYEELHRGIVDRLREQYLDRLVSILQAEKRFVAALYATSSEEINEIDERGFAFAYERLLGPAGSLVSLREQLLMRADDGLRPPPTERTTAEAPLWELEEFLFGFRGFLQTNPEFDEKLDRLEVDIELSVPDRIRPNTIWDLETIDKDDYRRYFFYSEDKDDSVLLKELRTTPVMVLDRWKLDSNSSSKLYFLWTDSPRGKREPGDPLLRLDTPMAPFLLAWAGDAQTDGTYLVRLRVDGWDELIPIEIRFPGRGVFPARPGLPTRLR